MNKQTNKKGSIARTHSTPKPTQVKKAHYISFNEQEVARLRQLGFRERWAYMELKGLSNWKTGSCGDFDRQCLSYTQIAALVTAPGTQGRGQGNIDDTQAADFLQRMETVGLVANIGRRANGGLRFDLPLSPIKQTKTTQSGEITGPTVGEITAIFPEPIDPQNAGYPMPPWDCEGSPSSLSVMINNKRNISNDGASPADAGAAPCRVSDAAPTRENLSLQPMAAAPLTAREIQVAISENWAFTETDTLEAKTLYESWADAGITLYQLQSAMISIEENPIGSNETTPAALHPKLWPEIVDNFVSHLAA